MHVCLLLVFAVSKAAALCTYITNTILLIVAFLSGPTTKRAISPTNPTTPSSSSSYEIPSHRASILSSASSSSKNGMINKAEQDAAIKNKTEHEALKKERKTFVKQIKTLNESNNASLCEIEKLSELVEGLQEQVQSLEDRLEEEKNAGAKLNLALAQCRKDIENLQKQKERAIALLKELFPVQVAEVTSSGGGRAKKPEGMISLRLLLYLHNLLPVL